MRTNILLWLTGGIALSASATAYAQASGPPPAPTAGSVDAREVMAGNRERDAAFNHVAGEGVKVTDQSRDHPKPKRVSAVPATAADIKPGAQVRDVKGVPVGSIATLATNEVAADPNQPVIDTGATKIGVPLNAFGKDDKGLLLSITAEKFNQLVAQVAAKAPPPEQQAN